MHKPQISLLAIALCCVTSACVQPASAQASDWMTWPSTYTHDPVEGKRVDQYALPVEPRAQLRTDFQRSGMRHYRSSLQAGQSSDNIHIVEQWGRQVIPYEQWRFPYRPYGVPYGAWGPQAPYGIINSQFRGDFRGSPFVGQPLPPGYGQVPQNPGGDPGGNPGMGQAAGGQQGAANAGGYHPGPGYRQPIQRVPAYGNNAVHPGYSYPGYGYPANSYPGGYVPPNQYPGGFVPPSNGFPLQPSYQGQPWFDGEYPEAPPLRAR